ncbi:MAG: PilN domain-containing protein [Minisyncoccales bacterium]
MLSTEGISSQKEVGKIIINLGIDLLLALLCFILILAIFYFFIQGELNSQKIIYEQKEKEIDVLKMRELEKNLLAFNKIFSSLDDFYQNRFRAAEAIAQIAKVVPPGVYLTDLSLNSRANNQKIIEGTLSGWAATREVLLEFKENLEKQEQLKEVYFPAAVWVKPTEINFTADFKIVWQ